MAGMAGISYVGGYRPGIGRNTFCTLGDFEERWHVNMYLCVQTAYYFTRARPQGSETFSECLALKWLPQMTNHTNTSTDQSELNALMFADTPKLAKNCFYKGNVLTGYKRER